MEIRMSVQISSQVWRPEAEILEKGRPDLEKGVFIAVARRPELLTRVKASAW
jgi:hypothetical protein